MKHLLSGVALAFLAISIISGFDGDVSKQITFGLFAITFWNIIIIILIEEKK